MSFGVGLTEESLSELGVLPHVSNLNIQKLNKMRIRGSRPVWDIEQAHLSKMSSVLVHGNELFTVQYKEICGIPKTGEFFCCFIKSINYKC